MSLNDDNKNNNSGNTEDIFAIMESYRAKQQSSAKNTATQSNTAPKKQQESDIPPRKSSSAQSTGGNESAKKTTSPSPSTKKASQPQKQKKQGLAERFQALTASIRRKFKKKVKTADNINEAHGPRPKEQPKAAKKAVISADALQNHFSDRAAVISDDNFSATDTSINIAAHLADTAPSALIENDAAPVKENTGGRKAIGVLKKIWYAASNMSFLAKAVIYVAVVCIISAYMSYYAITIANDVFAFVKSDREITVNVPENATDKEIAYLLEKNGLIEYDWVFELYLIYKTDDTPNSYIPGEKKLNSTMNYNQLIDALTTEPFVNEQISITIPEGFTVDEIIDLLVEKGIGTREGYVEAINNYPYKHEFVVLLDENGYPETRKYRLEGYLYPDTYFFYKSSAEYIVINKMLNNFQDKFWRHLEVFKADIEKHNMSVDDIVTLASMIQAEAKLFIDFESVSYVFHNRLTHPGTFPYLQSDATIQYVLEEHVEDFTQEQLDLDNPYNTYKYAGLPPGAICNPGYDALSAAIYPDTPIDSDGNSVNAYYFVSNKAGKTYYAETKAQHDRNKLTVKKENESYDD